MTDGTVEEVIARSSEEVDQPSLLPLALPHADLRSTAGAAMRCDAIYSLPRARNSVQNSDLAAKLGISPIDSSATVELRGFTDGRRVVGEPRMD